MIQSKLHSVSGVLCHSALGVRDLTAGLHKMISKALYQVRKPSAATLLHQSEGQICFRLEVMLCVVSLPVIF